MSVRVCVRVEYTNVRVGVCVGGLFSDRPKSLRSRQDGRLGVCPLGDRQPVLLKRSGETHFILPGPWTRTVHPESKGPGGGPPVFVGPVR